MATSNLRAYGYEAYVDAVATNTFLINTTTTVFTAPAACRKVEWALSIVQSAATTQTNYASFAIITGNNANALYAADVGDGEYGITNTYKIGWTSAGSIIGLARITPVATPAFYPALDPGSSVFLRWNKSNGSPGTMRYTIITRTYV
jgi:hypothetical protein